MTRNRRVPRLLRRWGADRRGTAAVEFAFVAGPFLLMIFAVIELALIFLLSTSLDAAADQAGRKIRTGQFQTTAGQTKDTFKADICAKMTWLAGNCSTALVLNVQTYDTYAQVQAYDPVDTTGGTRTMKPEADFPALPPQRIVVIRSFYKWPLITPLLNQGLVRLDGGVAVVTSTQTFMTEPYQ